MAALLSPFDANRSDTPNGSSHYHMRDSSVCLSTSINTSSATLDSLVTNRARQTSPVIVSSQRVLSNKENLSPLQSQLDLGDGQRTVSLSAAGICCAEPPLSSRRWSSANVDRFFTASLAEFSSDQNTGDTKLHGEAETLRWCRQVFRREPREHPNQAFSKTVTDDDDPGRYEVIRQPKRYNASVHSSSTSREYALGHEIKYYRDDWSLSDVPERYPASGSLASPPKSLNLTRGQIARRLRPSTISSSFVHRVKTASLSNTTTSFLSRSLRLTNSTEIHRNRGGDPRYSMESDRPTTTSSIDEAALQRGMKRRQVIEEIISSEECYIADLKALIFLYSTLLASASSLTSKMRSSIQRNVIDLLHLHEHILHLMHQLSLMSARRKWFDTASPRKLGISHHIPWRGLGSRKAVKFHQSHRYIRRSSEKSKLSLPLARAQALEPFEAAEMARLFKNLMPRFDAYEEYCAKHEIMMQELYRKIPAWSEYGMGIESLAISVAPLEQRNSEGHKALTVNDLMMKPIQRVCKYPLLLAELLRQTPVFDCPDAHSEIEIVLQRFRDAVKEINHATHSILAQSQIQRRWMLYEKLNFNESVLQAGQFRLLGDTTHCGVLHIAYQTKFQVDGCYALCALFASHLVIAISSRSTPKLMILAVIHRSDFKLESSTDGRGMVHPGCSERQLILLGLQCHTALFTWKLCFEVEGHLYELIMSACSAAEEEAWMKGLRADNATSVGEQRFEDRITSAIGIGLKPTGIVFGQACNLTRRLSMQRAATVGNRTSVCQVIIRGTHHAQDLQDLRQSSIIINRSQSHLTTHRTAILAPKRSERAKMEASFASVWTRDTLPPPSMTASRGGQIIRASAGSLARKLSLASVHAPFGRRSASLTLNSKKSGETFLDTGRDQIPLSTDEVKSDDQELNEVIRSECVFNFKDSSEAEFDKMEPPPVARMASLTSKRIPFAGPDGLLRRRAKNKRRNSRVGAGLGPEDPARKFYSVSEKVSDVVSQGEVDAMVEERLRVRKRWSNPMSFLTDGFKHMIFSSSHR